MLKFILGTLFGGFVAFVVMAIININRTDDEKSLPQPNSKEAGDSNARK